MYKTFYDNLPGPLRKPLSEVNSTTIRFKDSGAGISAESAGGDGGLRSFTCVALHMSEYAFSPNPEELKATAISALNNGQLIIESTANYFNDAHHQEIMRAQKGEADWNFLFFPWTEHEEYKRSIPDEEPFVLSDNENKLRRQFYLHDEQIYWRRKQIEKLGSLEKFRREYPLTIEEAYAQLGNSYFRPEHLKYVEIVQVSSDSEIVLSQPVPGDKYAIGVDVSAGVNRDYSVIYVLSKMNNTPVYIYRANDISPEMLAHKIQDVGLRYNSAKVLIESNNVGAVTLLVLRQQGYRNIWLDDNDKDWNTNVKTKVQMFELLKKEISTGKLHMIDNITFAEIRALMVNEKGIIKIPDNLESHADSAIALGLAVVCLQKLKLPSHKPLIDQLISRKRADRIRRTGGAAQGKYRRY